MKKLLATLVFVIGLCVAVYASTFSSNTLFQGEHVSVMMYPDGSCYMDSRETGRISGTYNISGRVEPGCSRVDVTFTLGGETVYGQLFWPMSEDLMMNFDNILLKRIY